MVTQACDLKNDETKQGEEEKGIGACHDVENEISKRSKVSERPDMENQKRRLMAKENIQYLMLTIVVKEEE